MPYECNHSSYCFEVKIHSSVVFLPALLICLCVFEYGLLYISNEFPHLDSELLLKININRKKNACQSMPPWQPNFNSSNGPFTPFTQWTMASMANTIHFIAVLHLKKNTWNKSSMSPHSQSVHKLECANQELNVAKQENWEWALNVVKMINCLLSAWLQEVELQKLNWGKDIWWCCYFKMTEFEIKEHNN